MLLDTFMPIYSRFHDWLMPPVCILCGHQAKQSHNICLACLQDLPILSHGCRKCAQLLPAITDSHALCGFCLKNSPPFDYTHALFPYQPPIIQLIIQLKFRQQLSIAQAFGQLLAQSIRSTWYVKKSLPDLIIPIPLHADRLRERGFNQALEIARPLARVLALPIDLQGVKRTKPTAAQSGLSARSRKQNMAQAFSAHQLYTGLSVAVIDDVITTGHTMMEFCKILKQQGAKRIDVWCCARRDIAIAAKTL